MTAFLGFRLPSSSPQSKATNHSSSSIPDFDTGKGQVEDWAAYRNFINQVSWSDLISPQSLVQDKVACLVSAMEDAVKANFPPRSGKHPGNKIPSNTRKLMRARKSASARVVSSTTSEGIREARETLARVELLLKSSYDTREAKLEAHALSKMTSDPKYFYKYAKSKAKIRARIGPLLASDGAHTSDPTKMAQLLSAQYSWVFSVPREVVDDDFVTEVFPSVMSPHTVLSSIQFSEENIAKAISALSSSASPGPDGVPTDCIKWGGPLVTRAMQDIFSSSMGEGKADQSMKRAFITPIWKGGNRPPPLRLQACSSHHTSLEDYGTGGSK